MLVKPLSRHPSSGRPEVEALPSLMLQLYVLLLMGLILKEVLPLQGRCVEVVLGEKSC